MTGSQRAVAKALAAAIREAVKYLKNDQRASYPLRKPVYVILRDPELAAACRDFCSEDGALAIENRGDGTVRVLAGVFPRSANLWNGPDIITNKHLRSMLASLFHDLWWGKREELSRAWGLPLREVLHLGDIVLYEVWVWASKNSWWGRREAWLAFQVCEFGRGFYHTAKKLLSVLAIAGTLFVAGCTEGCYTTPGGEVVEAGGVEEVEDVMGLYGDGLGEGD